MKTLISTLAVTATALTLVSATLAGEAKNGTPFMRKVQVQHTIISGELKSEWPFVRPTL